MPAKATSDHGEREPDPQSQAHGPTLRPSSASNEPRLRRPLPRAADARERGAPASIEPGMYALAAFHAAAEVEVDALPRRDGL